MTIPGRTTRLSYAILSAYLLVMVGTLAAIVYLTAQAAGTQEDPETQRLLARLAWTALAMLGLTVVLLVWALLRYVREVLRPTGRREPTMYVDAWSLAGKRLQVEPPETEDDRTEDDDPPPDGC